MDNFAIEHSDYNRAVNSAFRFLIEIGNVKKIKNNLYAINEEKFPSNATISKNTGPSSPNSGV